MRRQSQPMRAISEPSDAGYTLTEMLVVIAIIGVIAAVLTPNLMNQLSRARAKSAQLQLDTVAANIEMFRADVGRYPTGQEGLKALITEPQEAEGWTGPYLRGLKDLRDPWGEAIAYEVSSDNRFRVISLGADRKPGGQATKRDLHAPSNE